MSATMKPGVSSLNPYADSYIPLSKREKKDDTGADKKVGKDFVIGEENVWFAPPTDQTQSQNQRRVSHESDSHWSEKVSCPESLSQQNPSIAESYGFFPQNFDETDDQMMEEKLDMDLVYLQMTFPGLSNQSIADVYLANGGDLEETLEMLNQLELYACESAENLPDSLDIGDVPESGSSANTSLKLKNVASETGASSSGSSEAASCAS